jgi:hypothetical protein
MPMLVWLYLIVLLDDQTSGTCVSLAEPLETVSNDRLTRLLRAHGSRQPLLEHACRTLLVWEQGDFVLDDTVIRKPSATPMDPRHGSSPARSADRYTASRWSCGSGPMEPSGFPWAFASGARGRPSTYKLAREWLS